MSGREMEWEAPLPADLTKLISVLEADLEAAHRAER
jgi:hypothetical protein